MADEPDPQATVLQRLTPWIIKVDDDAPDVADETSTSIAKWLAAGFTAFGGLLTFFGIKEGALDRILRVYPRPALTVFCFIGLGVIAGVVAPLLTKIAHHRVRLLAVLVVVAGLWAWMELVLPKLTPDQYSWFEGTRRVVITVIVGVILLVVVVLVRNVWIPVIVVDLVVGVVVLSFGIYGGVKLSVLSKTSVETPQVSATSIDAAKRLLEINVQDSRLGDNQFVVIEVASSQGARSGDVIGRAVTFPEASGTVDEKLEFLLPRTLIREVSVRARECTRPRQQPADCETFPKDERARLRLDGLAESISGDIAPTGDGKVKMTLTGASVEYGTEVLVALNEAVPKHRDTQIATARVTSGEDGAISWSQTTDVQQVPGATVSMWYSLCRRTETVGSSSADATTTSTPAKPPTCASPTKVATYKYPASTKPG